MQLLGHFALHFDIQVRRNGAVGDVDLAAAEAVDVADFGSDRQEGRLIDHRLLVVPVARAALQHNALVHHPLFQTVSAVADIVGGQRPFVAEFLHYRALHRFERRVAQHADEIRHRFAQRHLQRLVVQRLDAEGLWRLLTGQDIVDIVDFGVLQVAGIGRGDFRIGQALPAVDEVLRGHRAAVAPHRAGAQVEGPLLIILVFPARRRRRHHMPVGVGAHQPFQQVKNDIAFRYALDLMRIQ